MTESVIRTSKIDALEGRDVEVVDIPGAYLSADMDDEVRMVFRGALAELMVTTDPAIYRPFVSYETGQAVLYVRLKKVLYGCLKSALLFYEKLVGYLETYGLRTNPYGPCMANKMVGRKQLTVCWHMENPNISCVDTNKMKKLYSGYSQNMEK